LGVRLLEAHVRLLLVHASLEGVPHSTPETVTMQEE